VKENLCPLATTTNIATRNSRKASSWNYYCCKRGCSCS